jgi:hypothetical protein
VREGEHGIVIIAPVVRGGRARDVAPADDEIDSRVAGYRAAYVFDVTAAERAYRAVASQDARGVF